MQASLKTQRNLVSKELINQKKRTKLYVEKSPSEAPVAVCKLPGRVGGLEAK